MKLVLKNDFQVHIANLLWAATDQKQVNYILSVLGTEAQVVYELMIATAFDEVTETDLAELVLDKIFKS